MFDVTLKRNRYSEPPFNEGEFSARHFDEDFDQYHLPLNRLQLANLQDWGVAEGLQVRGTPGDATIQVYPGVAVDAEGQLVSLSRHGKADLGNNPLNEEHDEFDVPVIIALDQYGQPDATLSYYLTIQHSEILRFEEGPLGRFEHAPWIRLQPVSGEDAYVEDGIAIVLAQLEIDGEGRLVELIAQPRRLSGKSLSELTFRRPARLEDQIQQVRCGKIGPHGEAGLQITVPEAADPIVLMHEDGGNFERLELRADNVNVANNLRISGNLEVQGDVIARDTEHMAGNIVLGDQDEDEIKITGVLRSGHSSEALQIDDAVHLSDKLTLSGDLGIGVDAPNRPLAIQGRGDASELVSFNNPAGATKWHVNFLGGGLNFVETGVWDYRLYLKEGGNVGIGTSAPRSRLDVAGTVTAQKIVGEGAAVRNMIMMWSGPIGGIPKGWVLCDGRNGTPNLRDRFVIGVTSDTGQRTGGSRSHSHTTGLGNNRTRDAIVDVAAAGKRRDNYSDEIHTHTVSTSDHLPPYYKLAFIMKL